MNSKHSIIALRYGEDGFHIQMRDEVIPAELLGDSTITNFVSVLRFRHENRFRIYSCVIFPDAIKEYRRLLVILR